MKEKYTAKTEEQEIVKSQENKAENEDKTEKNDVSKAIKKYLKI